MVYEETKTWYDLLFDEAIPTERSYKQTLEPL